MGPLRLVIFGFYQTRRRECEFRTPIYLYFQVSRYLRRKVYVMYYLVSKDGDIVL